MNILPWEQALIGAVLDTPGVLDEVDLIPSDFGYKPHRRLWAAIYSLYEKEALTKTNLILELGEEALMDIYDPSDETVRGEEYLTYLFSNRTDVPEDSALHIFEASVRRHLREAGALITAESYDESLPLEEIMENAEKRILDIRQSEKDEKPISLTALLQMHEERMDGFRNGTIQPALVPSLPEVRNVLDFLDDDDYMVVAARPGTGKSSYVRYEALKQAEQGHPTMIVNLENSIYEYARYLLSIKTGINSARIRRAKDLLPHEVRMIKQANQELHGLPIHILSLSSPSAMNVVSNIRKAVRNLDIKSVWIDYIQLIQNHKQSRYEDVTLTSQAIRASARRVRIPHIAVAQMNRAVEGRSTDDKLPKLSDLRDTGALEQDATNIMFLQKIWGRQERGAFTAFDENLLPNGLLRDGEPWAEPIKFYIAKNRNGPTGETRNVKWLKTTNTFHSMEAQ